jgi:hypothetical protein
MNKLHAFSSEMEKIAKSRVPSALLLGSAGAGLGAIRGSKGFVKEQRADDIRLRRKVITKGEWKRRSDIRKGQIATGAAAGAALGGMMPTLGKQFKSWVGEMSEPMAAAIGKNLRESSDYIEGRYSRALTRQVDYAMDKVPATARKSGRQFAEGLDDVNSVSPINVRVDGSAGMEGIGRFLGLGK